MGEMKNRPKLKNIEFIRFFFAVSIVYFHLLHSFMMPYTEGMEIYRILAEQSKYAKYIVECFFIISGYFLYKSVLNHPEQKTLDFVIKKIIRLWPVLAVSTILSVILLDVPVQEGILNLFFLQSTGLTTGWKGLNWYVSAFFFAEIFYFLLYKVMKNSAGMKLLTVILVYFGYVLNIMITDGGFGRKVVYGVFSLAMARSIAGVGLGYLLGNLYDVLQEKWSAVSEDIRCRKKIKIVISLIEIFCFIFLLVDFFMGKSMGKNQFIVVPLFSMFFLCMLTEKGFLSRLMSRNPICRMGKYSYSIYVMQIVSFYFLENTLWKNKVLFQEFIWGIIGGSLLVAVALGMMTYHLVEKPIVTAGKKFLM